MKVIDQHRWALYETQPSFVLGFHGCDESVGERILSGDADHLEQSENEYDWLGHGMYFWEANPQRAYEFACEGRVSPKVTRGKIDIPFVLGAIIDLGACLNLVDSSALAQLKNSYAMLQTKRALNAEPMPINGKGLRMKALDCAVFETLHGFREERRYAPYDSVRGVFWEGNEIYQGAGFREKNHIQICVRDARCIKGYFRPIELAVSPE